MDVAQGELNLVGYFAGNFTLQGEHIAEFAIVLPRPKVRLVPQLNELRRDAHPARITPHAPFKNVLHPESTAYLVQRLLAVLVVHNRCPRDHPDMLRVQVSQLRDHLFRQAIAEVVLTVITGEIFKRKNRQHQSPVRYGGASLGAGPLKINTQDRDYNNDPQQDRPSPPDRPVRRNLGDWDPRTRNNNRSCHVGIGYGGDEAIPLAGDGLYETRLFGIVLQNLPDLTNRSINAVIGVEEDILAPDSRDDVLPANDLSLVLDQDRQNLCRNALQFEQTTGAAQGVCGEVELEVLAKFN